MKEVSTRCLDCRLPYDKHGRDITLPDEQWRKLHDSEGGLLCGRCIAVRALKVKGVVAIRAVMEFARKPVLIVSKRWLTSLVSKLTYPKKCRHPEMHPSESDICDQCAYIWEKRVSRARKGILSKLKRDGERVTVTVESRKRRGRKR